MAAMIRRGNMAAGDKQRRTRCESTGTRVYAKQVCMSATKCHGSACMWSGLPAPALQLRHVLFA
jgi:hypothetical protein